MSGSRGQEGVLCVVLGGRRGVLHRIGLSDFL